MKERKFVIKREFPLRLNELNSIFPQHPEDVQPISSCGTLLVCGGC